MIRALLARHEFRLWSAVVTFTLLISFPSGYQMTYLNQPADLFREWLNRSTDYQYGDKTITLIWSVIVSLRIFGNVVGAIGSAIIADVIGRRDTIRLSAVPLALGDGISLIATHFDSPICMGFGRVITGIGDGMAANVIKTFFVEVAPANHRGKVGVFLMFGREIGMLLAIFGSGSHAFGTPALLQYIFLVPVIIIAPAPLLLAIFPKSPRFLYTTLREPEAAAESLRFYQGDDNELWSILDRYGTESLTRTPFKLCDILRDRKLVRAFGLSIFYGVALTFGGRFVCLNYSADLFREAGLNYNAAERSTLVTQAFGLPVVLFTMFATDKLGRRPIFITASIIVLFLQTITMVCFFNIDRSEEQSLAMSITVSLCVSVWIPIMIGGMAALNSVPAELFPQRARSVGNAIFICVLYGSGSVSVALFPIIRHFKPGLGMLFMIIPLLVSTVILYRWLPETSRRTVEDIGRSASTIDDEDFRLNSFTQRDYGLNRD